VGISLARWLVAALAGAAIAAAWYHWSWPPISFNPYDLWVLAGLLLVPVVLAVALSAPQWKPGEIAVSVFALHAAALFTALRLRWDDTNFGYDIGREFVAFGWGLGSLSAAIGTGALGAGIGWAIRDQLRPKPDEPPPTPRAIAGAAIRWAVAGLGGAVVATLWYRFEWGEVQAWPAQALVIFLAAPVVFSFIVAAPRCRPIIVAGGVLAFHTALVATALGLRWNLEGFGYYDSGRADVVVSWGLYALCAALITGAAGAGLAFGIRWLDQQYRLDQGR
jgi:hypothetical protein